MNRFLNVKRGLAALALVSASASAATFAQAWDSLDHEVTLVNRTSGYVMEFLASPVDRSTYIESRDQYAQGIVLAPGGKVKVDINYGDYCRYDLLAVLSDGTAIQRRNFNVCERSSWTITNSQ